jgi:hypothetical protein
MFESFIKLKSKLLTLILIIVAFFMLKPSVTFKPNGKVREYGVGYDNEGYKKTFYTFSNIILISSILIYVLNT